ncbi:MAG: MtrB/PioB family decaheme-associated outer membrane protein, partial [Sphingomonadales bacterium]
QMRDAYDSEGSKYWLLSGSDLGLESRSLRFEHGQQGVFSVHAFYDQIPKFLLDSARTPYIVQNGGTNLTLPAGWVPNDRDARSLTTLTTDLQDLNVDHERQKFGGGFQWIPKDDWLIKSEYSRENKKGSRTIAAIFGSSGGNPGGAIVPEPVDYETDNLDISIAYTGKRTHFALAYNLSIFRDNNSGFTFQNPFASSRWAAPASFPGGFGEIATPPDNKAHRISLSGVHIFNDTTRATANFTYGRMTQNDLFLPFTVNPDLVVPIALPRTSLNGEIETTLANLRISSRPSPKLTLSARYKYDKRDNNTPRDVFIRVPGDSQDQGDITGSTARINLPYSKKQHLFEVDVGYRLSSDFKLMVGYNYEQLERTFFEVAKTREHKIEAKLRGTISSRLSGWIGFDYADRGGTEYIDNLAFQASHTPEHLGPDSEDEFENHPLVRKFFIADRQRLKVNGSANWMPSDNLVFSVMGRYSNDDYDKSVVGLNGSTVTSVTLDASFNPHQAISYHAFYTYENLEYEQTGFANRRGTDLTDFAAQNWTAGTNDKVNTIGFGFEWAAKKDKLDITFDYNYSRAVTGFELTGGTALSFEPLPKLKTSLHMADFRADYQYTANLSVRMRYLFQSLDVTDFSLDGIDPDAMQRIIGLGNRSPDYNVHVIGISTIYRF